MTDVDRLVLEREEKLSALTELGVTRSQVASLRRLTATTDKLQARIDTDRQKTLVGKLKEAFSMVAELVGDLHQSTKFPGIQNPILRNVASAASRLALGAVGGVLGLVAVGLPVPTVLTAAVASIGPAARHVKERHGRHEAVLRLKEDVPALKQAEAELQQSLKDLGTIDVDKLEKGINGLDAVEYAIEKQGMTSYDPRMVAQGFVSPEPTWLATTFGVDKLPPLTSKATAAQREAMLEQAVKVAETRQELGFQDPIFAMRESEIGELGLSGDQIKEGLASISQAQKQAGVAPSPALILGNDIGDEPAFVAMMRTSREASISEPRPGLEPPAMSFGR